MPLTEEVYAEGRGSVHERLLPYAAQRLLSQRTTAISEPRRFFILFIGVFACVCASTGYVYNLFSGRLQEQFDLSQSDMATITTVANLLGLVAFPLASVYDWYGPQPLFAVALFSFPVGAVMFGLAFEGLVEGTVARFTVFNTLLGIGSGLFDTAGLMTVMCVFPSSRGALIAVMKTFIGLGSAVFSAIQLGFFEENVASFFFFMAAFVAVVSVLCFVFIRLPPYQLTGHEETTLSDEEKRLRAETKRAYFEQVPPASRFKIGFAIVGVLVVFLPAQSGAVAYLHLGSAYKKGFAIATCVLLAMEGLTALPARCLDSGSEAITERLQSASEGGSGTSSGGTEPITPQALLRASQRVSAIMSTTRGSVAEAAIFTMPVVDEAEHIAPQYQTSFRESVRTLKLWALSYSLFCVVGTQMVIILNARFIFGAVAGVSMSPATVSLLTVVNGVGSALGRILMALLEVWTQKRPPLERIPLTIALYIPSLFVLASSTLLLVVPESLLLTPFVLAALGNGFTAATVVLVMRTLYVKNMALHYNFTSLASITSSLALNKGLYGEWYTREARKQGNTLCVGRQCIFMPFAIMSALVLTSFLSNAYVHAQYRNYCSAVLAGRGHAPEPRRGSPRLAPNLQADQDEAAPLLEAP